uniref:Defensin, beta-like 2 n=1 Tax=Hucho hucho TaxID=62062 RepID=A0A4W5JJF1_9TELE
MKRLGFVVLILLLILLAVEADDTGMQYCMCGYRGLCRRFCYAQEYIVGHYGCPRKYRCCVVRF